MASDTHRHQVLIVDDDRDFAEAIATAIAAVGGDAATSTSAFEALGKLQGGLRPCLMLVDIRMPGMSGWAFLDRMRQDARLADIPVVVLSGDPPDPRDVDEIGIRAVLPKPVEVESVLDMVVRHCRLAPATVPVSR
jgi:two-component system response regulator MprA